jgi:WD40 repeat protein
VTAIAPSRPRVAIPATPYVGLTPFTEGDAPFFFGREKERRIIAANLLASRLTLLYGASGVGKSSIIRAGIQRDFRTRAEEALAAGAFPESIVVVFTGWRDDPIAGLAECIDTSVRELLGKLAPRPPRKTLRLDDLLVEWNRRLDEKALQHAGAEAELDEPIRTELLVVFDQFEQYFVYHDDEDGPGTFAVEFPRAVNRDDLRASFLISLREDAYTQLDRFEGRILNLFASNLRIEHLDEKAATAAIVKPIEKYNEMLGDGDPPYEVEPELVKAVITDVQAGNIVFGQAGGGVVEHAEPEQTRVETPFLQLVMSRLWDEEQRRNSHVLRLATLRDLGGAERIVRRHLDEAMSALDDDERAVAARMLHQLVTPSGTRVVHSARDLAGYAEVSEDVAQPILEKLDERRILRTIDPAPGETTPRFEIRHDVLAGAVVEWSRKYDERRRREEEEARQRQQIEEERRRQRTRMLLALALALAFLIPAVIGGIYVWTARQDAQTQRDAARSVVGAQNAIQLLHSTRDPADGVRAAFDAWGIHETLEAEEALRLALIESHRRDVLRAGSAPVLTARFGRNGRTLATVGADGTTRTWNVASGKQVRSPLRVPPPVSADMSPAGRLLVTAGGQVGEVWSLVTGRRVAFLRGHKGPINDVAFSRNGRLIVTAGSDGTARVWSATTLLPLGVIGKERGAPIYSSAFSPSGRLVVAGLDNQARIWSWRKRTPGTTLPQRGRVLAVGFSPDGRRVVTGGVGKVARVWRVRDGKPLAVLRGHTGFVFDASFSPDGRRLVTASQDGTARIWDVRTGESLTTLRGHNAEVYSATFSPDGRLVATGSSDGTARLWDDGTDAGRVALALRGLVARIALSPDGNFAAIAGPGNSARVWELSSGRPIGSRIVTGGLVGSVAFSPDSKLVVAASADGSARVMSLMDGRTVAVFRSPCGPQQGCIPMRDAVFSPDGKLVLTSDDGGARIWRLRDRAQLQTLNEGAPVTASSFSPNGKLVVTTGTSPALWDVATGHQLTALDNGSGRLVAAAFDPSGTLVTGTDDGSGSTLTIWTARFRPLRVIHVSKLPITSVSFSSDGKFIATSSDDGTARIWEAGSGRLLASFRGGRRLSNAVLSADDRRLFTVGADGVRTYSCEACLPIRDLLRLGHWQDELGAEGNR